MAEEMEMVSERLATPAVRDKPVSLPAAPRFLRKDLYDLQGGRRKGGR